MIIKELFKVVALGYNKALFVLRTFVDYLKDNILLKPDSLEINPTYYTFIIKIIKLLIFIILNVIIYIIT